MTLKPLPAAELTYDKRLFSFVVQLKVHSRLTLRIGWDEAGLRDAEARQQTTPVTLGQHNGIRYWLYRSRFYADDAGLTSREVWASLEATAIRRRQRLDRAEQLATYGQGTVRRRRAAIPDDVKAIVWSRDGGACAHCGSQHELQFDHVIPHSMGGADTVDNLQVLCGPCNRRKSSGITLR